MNFKEVPNKYRPIPFWSWNEKLSEEETKNQIDMMHNVGIGGFFMHARGGLQTEYLGEEWFANIKCAVERAEKLGMDAWAYDENGWPSGFGDGKVNGLGEKYQQKYLRVEKGKGDTPYTICNKGGYHFYYDINPFYVDTLDGDVIAEFIKQSYEPYYNKFKNDIKGFFTDEPQISRNGIPWSLKLPDEYKLAYDEDLMPHLIELFYPVDDYKKTRIRFWKLICELFSKNYMKQIYDWCTSRNLEFTGHLTGEEFLNRQLLTSSAVMPHYEYFTIPGMDWLGRNIEECLTARQLGSAAQQLGKKQVISESFALCGHNVSFEELRRIYEWQMVRGINLLCQHLEGYSLRGIRKRDYPPAMFYQQPWWEEYKSFNDAMSRVGMLLTEGKVCCDTLLIHPQTTAWTLFDNDKNEGLAELNQAFLDAIKALEQKHSEFHLGDEILMERHGKVDGKRLIIGKMVYEKVIILPNTLLLNSTKMLLKEYQKNGGIIITPEDCDENDIINNENITYTQRVYSDFKVYYFVNSTNMIQNAVIREGGKVLDITNGEILPFCGEYSFAPFESLVIIDDGTPKITIIETKELKSIALNGLWNIVEQSYNALTLDFCKYSFDEKIQEEYGYVVNIQQRACDLKRPVKIKQEFVVNSKYKPDELYLVIETPLIFRIIVNGKIINNDDKGFFLDKALRKIDIADSFIVGENSIVIECNFFQSQEVYNNIEKSKIFESEKNKLTFDMEIEPIYLVGNFSVKNKYEPEYIKNSSIRYKNGFYIDEPVSQINLHNIEQQGYPFFAGKIKLQRIIEIDNTNYKIKFNKKGVNAINVSVNGKYIGAVIWNPIELDISKNLNKGENLIELTIFNNLRNILGPHHLKEGESLAVTPASFYKEKRLWKWEVVPSEWDDDYCLVEFGI